MQQKGGINIQPANSENMGHPSLPDGVCIHSAGELPQDGLLTVCQQLSVNESRLLYIGLQALAMQLRQGQWQEIRIPTASIVTLFGGNKGYYDQLKKIAAKLVKKKIVLKGKHRSLFDHIRFNPSGGGLFIMFNIDIKDMLQELFRKQGMQITVKEVFEFKSRYTVRLLELFSRYMARQDVQAAGRLRLAVSIDDLKRLLGIPMTKTYEQITNIRHKILNIAVEEINHSTSCSVCYTAIKEGARVKAFLFDVTLSRSDSLSA